MYIDLTDAVALEFIVHVESVVFHDSKLLSTQNHTLLFT